MRALRWSASALMMLLACLLGLVGALLTATLVLAPVGIPVLFLARRAFKTSGQLVVPRAVRHPVDEGKGRLKDAAKSAASKAPVPGRKSKTDRVRHALHLG